MGADRKNTKRWARREIRTREAAAEPGPGQRFLAVDHFNDDYEDVASGC